MAKSEITKAQILYDREQKRIKPVIESLERLKVSTINSITDEVDSTDKNLRDMWWRYYFDHNYCLIHKMKADDCECVILA